RFLRARKYNLNAAKKMFIDAQNWRKSVKVDELYSSLDPFDFHTQQGRPLNFNYVREYDPQRLSQKGVTPERHSEIVLVNMECLTREVIPAARKKYGGHIDSAFVIIDLKVFGLSKFWRVKSIIQQILQVSQDYYPETLGRVAIINAPSTFTVIWNVMRPFLLKETAEKVDVLGSDYQERLLELIDEENLPLAFGGKCRCEVEGSQSSGPRCHLNNSGPWLDGRVGWGPNAEKTRTELEKSGAAGRDVIE
ncbi:hypothetical protein GYMLUDRAFT_158186, partial [Collybiopsis luxurians FD-317 M1]